MREGDLRNGATYCLQMCPAVTLRSAAGTHHARGYSPAHQVKDVHTPYRDRWGDNRVKLHTKAALSVLLIWIQTTESRTVM